MPFASKRRTRRMCVGGWEIQSRSSGASIVTNCSLSMEASVRVSFARTLAWCAASAMPRAAKRNGVRRPCRRWSSTATATPSQPRHGRGVRKAAAAWPPHSSNAHTTSAATAIGALTSIAPDARPAISARSGSAAGTSSGTLERRERFDVMRVREEVEEVERGEAPTRREKPARVAGERYRIACKEANPSIRLCGNGLDDVPLGSGAWRIEEDELGGRAPLDPRLDRRVNQPHVFRYVALRVLVRDSRALDGRDALANARDRHAEESDAGVQIDRRFPDGEVPDEREHRLQQVPIHLKKRLGRHRISLDPQPPLGD